MEQERLADAAIEDLHAALDAARRLLSELSNSQTGGETTAQAVSELQQTYLNRTGELRKKLSELLERRAAARVPPDSSTGNDTQLTGLQERKQELIQQVCAASETEAELMVQLRGLLDSFALWDAHKKHLEAPPPAATR